MTQYTYKQIDKGFLLLHGKTPVSVYPTLDLANKHAKLVTGKDAKPVSDEYAPQSVQPEVRPRGRPKKAVDK